MSRINFLVVALLVGGVYGQYLSDNGKREVEKVRSAAQKQLTAAEAAMAPTLKQAAADQQAAAKALGADLEIAQAFDDANKPTSAALEVAVSALAKIEGANDAAKPDLLVLISGGAAARYRVGASNTLDKDDSAYKVVGPVGEAHTLIAMVGGDAFQLAAAPLALTGDPTPPPVGQVVLGWALNDTFATRLSKAAGADVSIVADKKIIASTLPPIDKKSLPTSVRPGAPVDFGDLPGDRFSLFGLAKLPLGADGAAAQHALAVPLGNDATAVLSARVGDGYADVAADQKQLILRTALVVFICLVMMLLSGNPARGISDVAAVADKIAQGDLSLRAPTEKVASQVRRLAVAVNAITANAAQRSGSGSLGLPRGPSLDDQPIEALLKSTPEPAHEPEPEPEPLVQPKAPEPREPSFASFMEQAQPPPPQPLKAKSSPSPAPARRDDDFGGIFDSQPPPSSSAPPKQPLMQPPPPAPPPPSAGVFSPFQEDPDAFNPDATVVAQVPEALVRATRANTSPIPQQPQQRESIPVAVALPPPPANAEETHFQAVFREFVATRERCGEPADGLTYDKFVAKLRKNKDQLVAKYACKSVKFQVYVKDGKAALKATPVRE